jgi:hypothetical protein
MKRGTTLRRPDRGTHLPSLARAFWSRAAHAGAGGARSRAISDRISANICRGTATSAICKDTQRPWLTTFAPILISFTRRLVSDHVSAVFGIPRRRDSRHVVCLPQSHQGPVTGEFIS